MPDDPTTSSDVVTITSIDTEYTADSIEWCPYPQYSDVLLCGTYQLVNNDSNSTGTGDQGLGGQSQKGCRKGRLNAYLLNEDFKAGDSSALRRIAHTEMSGILDIKWNHLCDDLKPLFSVVDSDGCLSLWQLSTRDDEYSDVKTVDRLKIERIESVCLGINKLALSLDWSDRVEKSSPKIVSSDSQGMISLVDVNTYDLTVAKSGQEIICSYMDHGSIAYGADWCCKHYKGVSLKPTTDDKNSDCMAPEESSVAALLSTCSFYDHLMNVWLWNGHLSGVDV
ncbi:hypothetical protein LSH36_115g03042 [Paralvinella palmiformis]|uniref:Uncharacterized protein n=1 Tax=Paralvinella palmiformis TaxID=53620 RepID=A0AAD9JYQ0_9ANNE|nr:hypothetical protein LSH36_115g03042 [Paralvinella palmiformis]